MIANDCEDDLPVCIKLPCAVIRSIVAMRADGSNCNKLPDLFVVGIIGVCQTSSVQPFTDKMKQFHDNIEFKRFEVGNTVKYFHTPEVLVVVYTYANRVFTEMFNIGTWQDALLSKPKSSFDIYWKNRCWNCEQEGCNKYRSPKPPDKA